MNSDCKGGELLFSLGGNAIQLDFYLNQESKSQVEMRFVADSFNGLTPFAVQAARQIMGRLPNISVFVGQATRLTPGTCPPAPFADPAQALNLRWLFSTSSFGTPLVRAGTIIPVDLAVAGIFQTDYTTPGRGTVTFQETISAEGDLLGANVGPRNSLRGVTGNGSYIAYRDCTGGELTMNTNYLPISYAFVLTNNRESMYMLSLSSDYLLFGDATSK